MISRGYELFHTNALKEQPGENDEMWWCLWRVRRRIKRHYSRRVHPPTGQTPNRSPYSNSIATKFDNVFLRMEL